MRIVVHLLRSSGSTMRLVVHHRGPQDTTRLVVHHHGPQGYNAPHGVPSMVLRDTTRLVVYRSPWSSGIQRASLCLALPWSSGIQRASLCSSLLGPQGYNAPRYLSLSWSSGISLLRLVGRHIPGYISPKAGREAYTRCNTL